MHSGTQSRGLLLSPHVFCLKDTLTCYRYLEKAMALVVINNTEIYISKPAQHLATHKEGQRNARQPLLIVRPSPTPRRDKTHRGAAVPVPPTGDPAQRAERLRAAEQHEGGGAGGQQQHGPGDGGRQPPAQHLREAKQRQGVRRGAAGPGGGRGGGRGRAHLAEQRPLPARGRRRRLHGRARPPAPPFEAAAAPFR